MAAERVDVAIVGAGWPVPPRPMLARHGASVLVLDDNRHPGGQYLRGAGKPAPAGRMG
jgi:flavin-dependent dehydrogenase